MTRKDYVKIAAVINEQLVVAKLIDKPGDDERGPRRAQMIAFSLGDVFEADDPEFDRTEFLTACGVSDD